MRLLEREPQLASLRDYLHDVADGRGRLVLVSGEAGVGKTALLEEFRARAGGLRWLEGACDGLFTPRPLAPLMDVAAQVGGELEELTRTTGVAREQLFAALERELVSGSRPVALVVEDIHWADRATLDLLHFLARRVRAWPALLVFSYRDDGGSLPPDLRRTLGDLGSHGTTRRITVPALTRDAVTEMTRASGLGAEDLYRLTGGNPFFLTEALGAIAGRIPRTASDAVLSRVAELDTRETRALEVLALLGPRTRLDLLDEVQADARAQLDALVEHGLVRADGTEAWFRHEIAQLAVAESVPRHRAADVHRRALVALQAAGDADDAVLAHHADGAGDDDAVLEHSPAAAAAAARFGAHREAVVQYRRAVRAARNHAPDRLADLLDRLSVELGVTDAWDESTAVAEEALAIWEGEGEVLRAGDTLAHLTRAYWRMARGPESTRAADRALELLEPLGPTPELARALSAKAAQCMTSWRHEEAQDLATRAVALADQLDLPAVRSDALGTLGCVLFNTGGGWEPPVRQSIELALVHELHAQAGRNYANLIGLLAGRNRFADAFAVAEEGLVYSVEHDVGTYSRCIRGSYAQVLELTGRWAEADQALEELLALASSPENRIEGLGAAGRLAARRGQHARATELLDEAMASSSGTGETQFILGTRLACLEAAWHADLAEEVEAQGAELAALFPELDADDRGEVAVWLRRAGAEVPAGKVAGVWAVQLIDPAAAVAAWDELGCPFRAALAAVDAGGEAELRDALVRLDAMGASGTARIVRRMLRELGARSIPAGARSTTRANPHGLTAREQEILDRIVAGMGNPQIAADLVISPKTVEHHVSAILGKLGVADRREAAGLALAAGGFEDAVAEEAATGVAASAG